jgi:exodeoxyribonuclease VII large subunit
MRVLHVSEFLEIVNGVLRETLGAEVVAVEGEVSGYRVSQGQWVSFDLKDEKALVNVFLPLWNLNVPMEDGIRVRVFGLPRVYPKYGKFSLSADRIELAGEGALKKALALLRLKLEKEGLFDPSRKRSLPRFPTKIALIASRESAAYGDFIRIVGERWGGLEIDLYHVLVQGEKAPKEIVEAIEYANELSLRANKHTSEAISGRQEIAASQTPRNDKPYDVLVITRGGGSLEELMAFNDERVARAVHASKIPTLVAIGHERDLTFAEEAADVRGSTPTDCARRLVPDRKDVAYELISVLNSIETDTLQIVEQAQVLLDRSLLAVSQWLRVLSERLESHRRVLLSCDPRKVLARGYAIVKDRAGKIVSSAKKIQKGDELQITVKDGTIESTVI